MDPLSIVASVAAIIQITDRIISICKSYITTVKDAPRDLRMIMIETGSIRIVLEVLESLASGEINEDSSIILKNLKNSGGLLEGCGQALATLDSLFPAAECKSPDSKRRKTLLSLKNLAWPLKQSKARKLLEDIGRYKESICLTLTTESVHDIKTIKCGVQRLDDVLSDEQHERILKWLIATDPSSNHVAACNLHEPHTGTWLTRSPDYKRWMEGSIRFLWLHGIPGSGKTVLTSFIIEEVKKFCSSSTSNNSAWAYYYFYFKREKDEAPQFLRWVINQLCRQSKYIPMEVRRLYSDGCEPTTESLLVALAAVLKRFQRVYLLLDALDESSNRPSLLDVLVNISSTSVGNCFQKLTILAASRKELDIERALKNISTDISLQNCWVDEDICLYIQNHIREDRKLNRWPEALRADIEAALAKGAQGMDVFTIILDILGRLKSTREIRAALDQLPKTLDETYERIFAGIPTEHVKFARRALHLLAFDFQIYSLEELAEAVIVDDASCTFIPGDRFVDPTDILEICTCLIIYDRDAGTQVRLAHYSVKEYLTSERMKATEFKTSEITANILAAKTCITYYLNLDYRALEKKKYNGPYVISGVQERASHDRDHFRWNIGESFPLVWVAENFDRFVKISGNDDVVNDLVLKLLNPGLPHFEAWFNLYALFDESDIEIPEWKMPQAAQLTITLAYLCWFDFQPAAKALLERQSRSLDLNAQLYSEMLLSDTGDILIEESNISLLHLAVALGREGFAELLVTKGINTNAISSYGVTALNFALAPGTGSGIRQRMVDLLLKGNADPNPHSAPRTPLQDAIVYQANAERIVEVVRMLLDAGADANAIGDDTAIIAEIQSFAQCYGEDPTAILNRGERDNYKTPLRLLEEGKCYLPQDLFDSVRELLIKSGAKSLYLPPDNKH
ncbi:hypothetical protein GP486_006694 [Trichoglossum hirsutum]|uniref:NACHT domain-containing protein n=1 Tax=Trichoglossum hirsutum TaxID=265104 RepID=A0A9P8L5E2_9PEZI|nr:hypothetical protein GP486_006694 [Trichoglossum hirsutum]